MMSLKDSAITEVIVEATVVDKKKLHYNPLCLTFHATIVKFTMTH